MNTPAHKPVAALPRERGIHNWIVRSFAQWARHREMKQTVRALHRLPDFALRDIGIHRSEINGVATFRRLNERS